MKLDPTPLIAHAAQQTFNSDDQYPASDLDIAEYLGVNRRTIYRWKRDMGWPTLFAVDRIVTGLGRHIHDFYDPADLA